MCMHASTVQTHEAFYLHLKRQGHFRLVAGKESLPWGSLSCWSQPFAQCSHSSQLLDISLSLLLLIFVLGKAKSCTQSKRKIKRFLWKPATEVQNYSIIYCSAAGIIIRSCIYFMPSIESYFFAQLSVFRRSLGKSDKEASQIQWTGALSSFTWLCKTKQRMLAVCLLRNTIR